MFFREVIWREREEWKVDLGVERVILPVVKFFKLIRPLAIKESLKIGS